MGWLATGATRRSHAPKSPVAFLSFLTAFSSVIGIVGVAAPAAAATAVSTPAEFEAAVGPGSSGDVVIEAGFVLTRPVTVTRSDVLIYGIAATAEATTISAPPNSPALIITGTDVTIRNVAFDNANDRKAKGGAISVDAGASLTLDMVSVHDNFAGEGGGLYNAGTVTVRNSAFYRNSAAGKGGGISNDGTLSIENSTFAKNDAQQGGAVSTAGTATFQFATVVGNSSKNKIGAGTHLTGGTIRLINSIVANNYSGGSFYDCSGQTEVDHVVFSSTQGCQPNGVYQTVPVISFPNGEEPYDNGGPTKTVALTDQDSSTPGVQHPAMDYASTCLPADQRGVSRPQGPACDVGAFERDVTPPTVTISTEPGPNGSGWNNGAVQVILTPDEPATLEYRLDGGSWTAYTAPLPVSAEGTTVVEARGTDLDANTSAVATKSIRIDLTDPTVAIDQRSGAAEGDIDVTISGSDALSGVASVWYQVGSSSSGVSTPGDNVTVTVSSVGTTTISYNATDVAGNASTVQTVDVTIDPLTLEVSLAASDSTIEVGAVTVPLVNIQGAIRAASGESTSTSSTPLSAIPLSAIPLSAIGLSAAPLSAIPLSAIPLSAIPIDGTPLSAIPLSAIPLSAIPLSAIPLSAIPLSGTPLSAIPLSAILLSDIGTGGSNDLGTLLVGSSLQSSPLQALTFDDLIAAPLSAIDFSVSPLSAIPLSAIPLSAIGDVFDCEVVDCTSGTLGGAQGSILPGATIGDVIGFDDVGFESTPLSAIPLSAIALGTVPLSAIPLSAIDAGGAELTGLDAWCFYLGTVCDDLGITSATDNEVSLMTLALAGVPLSAIPLSAIPLSAIPLSAIPLSAIPLSAIDWASTPLSAIPLSAIPLSAICLDATACSQGGATLGDVPTLGGFADTATIGLLEGAIPDGYSLADLLYGFLAPESIPWQDLDLNASRLPDAADPKQPTFTYTAGVTVGGARTATVDVVLDIPDGFVPAYDMAEPLLDGGAVARPVEADGVLTFSGLSLSPGSHDLVVPMRAGIVLGTFEASVTASGSAPGTPNASAGPATASITVVEAGEGAGPIPLIQDGSLELSHISYSDDIDLYGFAVGPDLAGASARILLSNLPADYDLVLYGPSLQEPLRGDPQVGYGTVEDFTYDLNPDDDTLDTDTLEDVPNDPPAGSVLHAISATRGTNDEEIVTGTLREGDYYIQVSSYNGVSSNDPFALRVRLEGSALGACDVSPLRAGAQPAASLPSSYPAGLNTLFLYNEGWLDAAYGADAGLVLNALSDVGTTAWTNLGVIAAAVPVDADPGVWSALQAWDANRCDPGAANDVVRAIGGLIDSITSALPADTIENVVIVGDDSQIPFARIPDGVAVSNETDHGRTIATDGELRRALAGGFYFSDDPYGADQGISVADHEFFVPRRAVGRLVETPSDIVGALTNFVAYNGVLDTSTGAFAAASGYDFLADGTEAVIGNLEAGGFTASSLNDPTLWTRQNLIDLLSAGNLSVASINAHFDQSRALPALGNSTGDESDLFTVGDLPSSLVDAMIFSMGCHAGLSVSDIQIGTTSPDWAQSHAGLGNLYAANSGFGYGDTQVVAYSEQLSAYFAEYLTTMPVGQAWVAAKQRFASQLFTLTPYHEKVSQEFVFYGLPMFTAFAPAPVAVALAASATTTADLGPTVIADPFGDGVVAPVGIDLTVSETSGPGNLHEASTPAGSYYEVDGETLLVRGRPVQPLTGLDVTRPDGSGGLVAEAGGAIITGLEGFQITGFDPLVFNPIVDLGDGEDPSRSDGPRFRPGDATFPAGLQRVVSYVDETGQPRQRLLVVPGRYRADGSVQELFTGIEALVHYRDPSSSDFKAPFIRQSIGRYGGGIVHFEVDVRGDGPVGSDDVERVYVLYRPKGMTGSVVWQGVDLARVPGTDTWLGGRPVAPFTGEDFEFFVQAVDGNANVASATSKGVNFLTVQPGSDASISITVAPAAGVTKSPTGWYSGSVTATATSSADTIDSYVLDGISGVGSGAATQDFPVSGDGGHLLLVFDSTGRQGILFVAIDATAPVVSASVVPDAGGGWIGTSGVVTINAFDPFGSGVVAVEYSLDDGGTWTSVQGSSATVIVSETATVTYRAIDGVGHTSEAGTISVQIDTSAPVVSASVSPAPDAAGWVNATAAVSLTADDEGRSGVSAIEYSLDGGATWETYSQAVPITGEGTTTVWYRATDNVGNGSTPASIDVKVDTVAPAVTIASPAGSYGVGDSVLASYACTDLTSGIVTCSGDVATGAPIDTSTVGDFTFTVTATDVAGNTTVATSAYSVVDVTAPVVSISSPNDGAAHVVGSSLTAVYSCTDDSGVCTITSATIGGTSYANGATIPTNTPGTFTLTVTATDGAGNTASASVTFTVEWGICLLYDPDNAQPLTGAVAIKVQLCDVNGANESSPSHTLTATQLDGPNGSSIPQPDDSGKANSDPTYDFRYDPKLKGYIYNLNEDPSSLVPGLYHLHFTVDGAGEYAARFTLK